MRTAVSALCWTVILAGVGGLLAIALFVQGRLGVELMIIDMGVVAYAAVLLHRMR